MIPTDQEIIALLAEQGWYETVDGWLKLGVSMAPQTMLAAAKWEVFFLENAA